jgi:uncharacterized protein involved in outer membrane biogenesis
MFGLLRFIILLLAILAIIAGAYLWMARVSTLERFLSSRLNAKVTIEEVNLSWKTLSIKGLRIANPSKSAFPYAFQSEVLAIELNPFELLQKTIQIDKIEIQNPTIGIELYNSSGTDNNWARILNNFPSGRGERKFIVKKLSISNLQFQAVRSNGKSISIPSIPSLEFENLGEKLSLSQLGRVLFQIILQKVSIKGLLENVPPLPKSILDGVNSKSMFQAGLDAVRRKTKEATEFLQELLD